MFDPSLLSALGDAGANNKRRQEATERALAAGQPSFTEEVWRYSPIDELDTSQFAVAAPGGSPAAPGLTAGLDEQASAVVHLCNGAVAEIETRNSDVVVQIGAEAEQLTGSVLTEGPDAFGDWNLALCAAPLAITIAAKAVIEAPIVVHCHTDVDGLAWFPRLIISANRLSQATVVEHHTGGHQSSLICPVTELQVDDGANLSHLTVQELGTQAWQIASQCGQVGRDANLHVGQVAIGGKYARTRIETKMCGSGSHSEIDAVYFGNNTSTIDFRTFQTHSSPHTTSDLLFKGAVDDQARAVYTGMIRIEPNASGVVAEQTNRNLKLSPDAWAESVPNLEIENNDVKCSHASSIGPVDAEQRFYLETRGVPSDAAEALVVRGFFDEVLEALPLDEVASQVRSRIDSLLDEHAK